MSDPAGRSDDRPRAFLFTDIADSTVLWEQHPDAMGVAAAELDELITSTAAQYGGQVVKRVGDAMDLVFDTMSAACAAAVEAQRAIGRASWDGVGSLRVRMAIDVGVARERDGALFGPVLNRLGRILAAGHGGQILASAEAAARIDGSGAEARDLGEFRFKGIGRPQRVFQICAEGLDESFPPLRVTEGGGALADGDRVPSVRGYELREILGTGPLGSVYRAWQTAVGREVAVKVIDREVANGPRFVRRFESAAQSVARLEHPHLVGLFDYWRDPEGAYLVMPLLRGGSVAGTLERGPWSARAALRLLEQVGSGLSYAHRNGHTHGAVRPSNVLLDDDGNAHLADLAIAAHRPEGASDLRPPVAAFVAPEHREEGGSSRAGDVYSLGVLIQEILTGGASQVTLPDGLDAVLAEATALEPGHRHVAAEDLVAAVTDVLAGSSGVVHVRGRDVVVRNPYKGLRAFTEADAGDFFGREELVAELADAIGERRLVAVFGPSGSGKSSLVRAGLIPALRRGVLDGSDRWLVTDLMPGTHPFEELEAALLRVAVEDPGGIVEELRRDERGLARVVKRVLPPDGSELVLIIDQFEELFVLVDDASVRDLVLSQLAALVTDERGRVRVVVTMRADFADRALDHPDFAELFKSAMVPVTPPTEAELERAIVEPARSVGLDLEPGLAAEIVADVRGQPGSLPLLQHVLSELFRRREDDRLTVAAYRASGGVAGALARTAETTYEDLREEARTAARQVFLRLVALGEGTEDTRRRVRRSELLALPDSDEAIEEVLAAFGHQRLLSFDRDATTREPTVEVAHEALLRRWDRLRRWIDEARDDLRRQRRVQEAVVAWEEAGRDPAYLMSPRRFEAVDEWLATSHVVPTAAELRYIEACRDHRAQLEAAEAERVENERRLERRAVNRLRATIGVLLIGGLVAAVLATVTVRQQQVAEQQRALAEHQERAASAQQLADLAQAEITEDPARGLLLAAHAVEMARDDPVALGAPLSVLHDAMGTPLVHVVHGVSPCPGEWPAHVGWGRAVGCSLVAFGPTGADLAVARDDDVVVLDVESGQEIRSLPWRPVASLAFDPEARLTAGGASDIVHDVVSGAQDWRRPIVVDDGSPAGSGLSMFGEWGDRWGGADPPGTPDQVGALEWSADGSRLATAGGDHRVRVHDVTTGELLLDVQHGLIAPSIALEADGGRLHSPVRDGPPITCSLADGTCETVRGAEEHASAVALDRTDEHLAIGTVDGAIRIRDLETGSIVREFPGHPGGVAQLRFAGETDLLVSAGEDRIVRVWDPDASAALFEVGGHRGAIHSVAISPSGDHVASVDTTGTLRVWRIDGSRGAHIPPIVHDEPVHDVAISASGQGVSTDGRVRVWSVRTAELLDAPVGEESSSVAAVATLPDGGLATLSTPRADPTGASDRVAAEIWEFDEGGPRARSLFEERGVPGSEDGLPSAFGSSPDGRWLAGSPFAGLFHLWDTESGERGPELDGHQGTVSAVGFAPRGRLIASGDSSGRLRLWRGDPPELLAQLAAHEGSIRAIDFSPDGDLIATGGADHQVAIWSEEGDLVWNSRAHTGEVTGLAFLPDGRLASSSMDGTVRIWDVERGVESLTLSGHVGAVNGIAADPDGRIIASAGQDGTVRLHLLDVDDLLSAARERAGRSLTAEECEEFILAPCPERPSATTLSRPGI